MPAVLHGTRTQALERHGKSVAGSRNRAPTGDLVDGLMVGMGPIFGSEGC